MLASDKVIYRIRGETPFAVLFLNDFGKGEGRGVMKCVLLYYLVQIIKLFCLFYWCKGRKYSVPPT